MPKLQHHNVTEQFEAAYPEYHKLLKLYSRSPIFRDDVVSAKQGADLINKLTDFSMN